MRPFIRPLSGLGLLMVASSLVIAQDNINFSGTWVLDKSQREMPAHTSKGRKAQVAGDVTVQMMVDHRERTLKVTRIIRGNTGPRSRTYTYILDGSEATGTGPRASTIVSRATWEGNKLVITSQQRGIVARRAVQMRREDVWSLSPDGQTLMIEATVWTAGEAQTMMAVFNKR